MIEAFLFIRMAIDLFNYETNKIPLGRKIEIISKHLDFIKGLDELDFIDRHRRGYEQVCLNFTASIKLDREVDRGFYESLYGQVSTITLYFCFQKECYILQHNYYDIDDIENPTIDDVKRYFNHESKELLKHLRLDYENKKIEAENRKIAERVKRETAPCTIYIALDTSCGYHKIGRSKNVANREQVLMAQKPTIKVVAQFEGVAIDESNLHHLLKEAGYHIRGEWFNLNKPESLSIIQNYFKSK